MKFVDLLSKFVLIPAAALYVTGWIYLYSLCRPIGLDASILDLDTNTIIVNSYHVFAFVFGALKRYSLAIFVVIASLIVLIVILSRLRLTRTWLVHAARRTTHYSHLSAVWISRSVMRQLLLYVTVLAGLAVIATSAALHDLARVSHRPGARMVFGFTEKFTRESEQLCSKEQHCFYPYLKLANEQSRLRMLLETPDFFVLWVQPLESPDKTIGQVYILKREEINFASVLDVETCRGENRKCN